MEDLFKHDRVPGLTPNILALDELRSRDRSGRRSPCYIELEVGEQEFNISNEN